jgi:3-oxoacid CoA-transferase B subunit
MDEPERLHHAVMAMVVAREFRDGDVINLGIGLPLACGNYVPEGREVLLHSEQGLIGFGRQAEDPSEVDPYVNTVGNRPVLPRPGMAFMSHEESFALARGGHIDLTVLGAYEVDVEGNLANTHAPGKVSGNLGGAPDLATCARRTFVMMYHTRPDGQPKIVERCTLPLTAARCVDRIITDVAVMDVTPEGIVLREHAPGWTPGMIEEITGAPLRVAPDLREISLLDAF